MGACLTTAADMHGGMSAIFQNRYLATICVPAVVLDPGTRCTLEKRTTMQIQGFDYIAQRPTAHSRQEWAFLLQQAFRRRVEHGETFAHDEHGLLLFEVYANIPASEPDWLK